MGAIGTVRSSLKIGVALGISLFLSATAPSMRAQQAAPAREVTFTKDIAPIVQRSCENCHRADGVAPMSLSTYEDARPWARAMKQRTGIGPKAGVMPPWYVEKNIGIQQFHNDPSLSDDEIAMIAKWADTGAPRGNPADMPPPRVYPDRQAWAIGTPDLIIKMQEVLVKSTAPDWWGEVPSVPTGLTEDRYVAALEIKEVNDVDSHAGSGRATVGGRFVFHHMIWRTQVLDPSKAGEEQDPLAFLTDEESVNWPVHEVGRNADFFDPKSARLLKAGSSIVSDSVHLHSNGRDTTARIEIGFKFHPKGYKPTKHIKQLSLSTSDIDLRAMDTTKMEAFLTLDHNVKLTDFEPHMHAAGIRMCLDVVNGSAIETLTCAGYNHAWVRVYPYADDSAPLLPKGTILRMTGYFDNTPANKNQVDPRNWSGYGERTVDQMFISLLGTVELTDAEFEQQMAQRRQALNLKPGQMVPGCPMCGRE